LKVERVPFPLRVPKALKQQIELVAGNIGISANAWAIQALAKGVKNHIPLEDFITQAPTRGTGRNKKEVGSRLSVFTGLKVDKFGWPSAAPTGNGSDYELKQRYESGGEEAVDNLLTGMWEMEGIGAYTFEHLNETLRQLGVE
jgi:hypothetical protein